MDYVDLLCQSLYIVIKKSLAKLRTYCTGKQIDQLKNNRFNRQKILTILQIMI